jgi:nitrate reductase NapE component
MSEQPNYGQPNQQPYPYQQPPGPPGQPPYPQVPPQQGYQGPPPQQPYPNPYPQQQPYPPQQPGPAQQYPAGPQYPGQQPQFGQQPYGQPPYGPPPQGPNQPPGPDQAQTGPKPKKKRSRWATFFIVLFSPFIALAFVVYGIYWVLCWLLTPVALAIHFVLCGLGLIWFSLVKVLASGRSRYRLLQPMYPKFPPFWTGQYWVRLNRRVRSTFEGLAALAELFNW